MAGKQVMNKSLLYIISVHLLCTWSEDPNDLRYTSSFGITCTIHTGLIEYHAFR